MEKVMEAKKELAEVAMMIAPLKRQQIEQIKYIIIGMNLNKMGTQKH